MSRKKELNRVIDMLVTEKEKMIIKIQLEQGSSKEEIALKEELTLAIKNLKWCSEHEIDASQISTVEILEMGSDAYFTSFYMVDEGGLEGVADWAILKNGKEKIELSCFDLIVKREKGKK